MMKKRILALFLCASMALGLTACGNGGQEAAPAEEEQQETQLNFYANELGFRSEIHFCESIDDAHMLVIQGKGYMPIEGSGDTMQTAAKAVKLIRNGSPVIRRYCAFMKADNPSKHTSEFIEILKNEF